jgi:hypothetical protein
MTNDDGRKPEGAPERSPKARGGDPSGIDGNGPKRFSVQRKMAIVSRLLRGEPLELVARPRQARRMRAGGDCADHQPAEGRRVGGQDLAAVDVPCDLNRRDGTEACRVAEFIAQLRQSFVLV